MFKFILPLMLAVATLTGCAGLQGFFTTPSTQQTLAKIAVQQATVRAIQANPAQASDRATAVVKVVDEAVAVLNGAEDGVITSEELRLVLDRVLPKDLEPADKLLVAQLTELIVAEVNARVPGELQGLPVAEISVVLGWIRDAAAVLVVPDVA